MSREIEIKIDSTDIRRIRERLKDMTPILDTIGETMVSHSWKAFQESQFGTFKWSQQYGSRSPYINKAGALADLLGGGKIKPRRFTRDRPLIDSGHLSNSIAYRILGSNEVEYGSALPYAGIHQTGGKSTQPITRAVKKALGKEMKSARKKKDRTRLDALKTMGYLFQRNRLETKVFKRPFVGMTDEMRDDIRENIEIALTDFADD